MSIDDMQLASCLAREPLIFIMRQVQEKQQAKKKKKLYYAVVDLEGTW